jgi:predicted kinase
MKRVIIMRGIPGSGKSTRARELVAEGIIHSTDDLFMVDGEYVFNHRMLGYNHGKNLKNFIKSLGLGLSPVIVDNTNVRHRDYKEYVTRAAEFGYDVQYEVLPLIDVKVAVERNTHNVPEFAIQRMIDRWQD